MHSHRPDLRRGAGNQTFRGGERGNAMRKEEGKKGNCEMLERIRRNKGKSAKRCGGNQINDGQHGVSRPSVSKSREVRREKRQLNHASVGRELRLYWRVTSD